MFRFLLLASQGMAEREAARIMGVGRRTFQEWIFKYRQGGLAALENGPCPELGITTMDNPILLMFVTVTICSLMLAMGVSRNLFSTYCRSRRRPWSRSRGAQDRPA